jgi:hypothetical protein
MTSEITNRMAATKLRYGEVNRFVTCADDAIATNPPRQAQTGEKGSRHQSKMRDHKQR